MARLGENRYGKSRVRLSRITRFEGRHEFQEWSVRVLLEGNFETSFTEADNSSVLPTDTMKNTVYYVARGSSSHTMEEFACELGDYFLDRNLHVSRIIIQIDEKAWTHVDVNGSPEPTTFKLGGPELHTVRATRSRGAEWAITSGVDGLVILKTTKSGFTGYIKDDLTTLKPATDRIFGTSATASWDYAAVPSDYAKVRATLLQTLLTEFAAHDSKSVQHTLFDMGKACLDAAPQISRIKLTMPNLHHLLADLSPFGQDNPNHIFVPIDEPHGYIEATIER